MTRRWDADQEQLPEQWESALESDVAETATAFGQYREDRSPLRLAAALGAFVRLESRLFVHRPQGVSPEAAAKHEDAFARAAELLIGNLITSPEDRAQFSLPEHLSSSDWLARTKAHAAGAKEASDALGSEVSDAETSRQAVLGAAAVIRLGQLVFSRVPPEFRANTEAVSSVQRIYLGASSDYLSQLAALSPVSPARERLAAETKGEQPPEDLEAIELPDPVQAALADIDRSINNNWEYVWNKALGEIRGALGQLSHQQKQAFLWKLYQPGQGLLWRELEKAKAPGRGVSPIELSGLWKDLSLDASVDSRILQESAQFVFGPGGLMDIGSRGEKTSSVSWTRIGDYVPSLEGTNIDQFVPLAAGAYRSTLTGFEEIENPMDLLREHHWYLEYAVAPLPPASSRLLYAEYKVALSALIPRLISANTFYDGVDRLGMVLHGEGMEWTPDEFGKIFDAWAATRFGFERLSTPETIGKSAFAFQEGKEEYLWELITDGGVFSEKGFSPMLTDLQRIRLFEAITGTDTFWQSDGTMKNWSVRAVIEKFGFFDHAAWDRERKKIGSYRDEQRSFDELMCSRRAVQQEIDRRKALLERELMINLAMVSELPVRDPAIDRLVESQELRSVIEGLRQRAQEIVASWREEAATPAEGVGDSRTERERLFFGADHATEGYRLRLGHLEATLGLPGGSLTGLEKQIAEWVLSAGHDNESRDRLLADVAFVQEHHVGDIEKLLIHLEKRSRWDEPDKMAFLFSELPDDRTNLFLTEDASGSFSECHRIVESLKEAPSGFLLAGIRDRLAAFLTSSVGKQLEQALAGPGREGYTMQQKIFGLLGHREMEPVRDAIRHLVMLRMFTTPDPIFGQGTIALTDGHRGVDRAYPPLLIGLPDVAPYSVGQEAAWSIVVGPNGGGKTNLITALTVAESLGIAGIPPFADAARVSREARGIPGLVIDTHTTSQVSRFDSSVREARATDQRLGALPSVALDEPFAGTGARYRGHLQTALALKALARGVPVRMTTHQTETVYADTALLGIAENLSGLGLPGNIQWLSVDSQHRIALGRVSPFGIEMATGAGYPTIVAENAKKVRDAFPGGRPVTLERIAGNEREPKPLPEWASQDTLLRLGINGHWSQGFHQETALPKGEGDVLKFLFAPFDQRTGEARLHSPTIDRREELLRYGDEPWFVRTMARFMQRPDRAGAWQERQEALKRYVDRGDRLATDLPAYWTYGYLLDRLGIVSVSDYGYDREQELITSDPRTGHTEWSGYLSDLDADDLRGGQYAARFHALRRMRKGKTSGRTEVASAADACHTVGEVSGVSWSIPEVMDRLAEGLEQALEEHHAARPEIFARAVAARAIAQITKSHHDFSKNPDAQEFIRQIRSMGYHEERQFRFSGTNLEYFLPRQLKDGSVAPVLSLVAEFGSNHLGGEELTSLFDRTLERELQTFGPWAMWQKKQESRLSPADVMSRLSAGDAAPLVEFLDWLERLPDQQKEQYRSQVPATMALLQQYQRSMDLDLANRWEDHLRGELADVREQAIGAFERANVNLVLSECLRQTSETHLRFTETSERGEVVLSRAYNPGSLRAGIQEVPQSADISDASVAVISGPNTGGKTSLGKKLMVAAALHKAVGVGVGDRILLPHPDTITGLFVSINAAETRVGEGNLASEARDVGRFLHDYLAVDAPPGIWVFVDEGFSGTGQADQAGLGTAIAHLVADRGGRAVFTTNEEGLQQGLDQAGVRHQDIRFVYGDPSVRFVPQPGVGGAESFRIARDLGLDPKVVELAEQLDVAYQMLKIALSGKRTEEVV